MIVINKLLNKEELYLELALTINKSIYDDKEIPYHIYRETEDKILKKITSIQKKKT